MARDFQNPKPAVQLSSNLLILSVYCFDKECRNFSTNNATKRCVSDKNHDECDFVFFALI